MRTFIYGLFDPLTNELKYVGRTRHLNLSAGNQSRCIVPCQPSIEEWVVSLRRKNLRPEIRVLEECDGDGAEQEQAWIRKSLAAGHPILNDQLMNHVSLTSSLAVRLPRDVIEDFKAAARSEGVTVSEWLMAAGKEKLEACEFVFSPS